MQLSLFDSIDIEADSKTKSPKELCFEQEVKGEKSKAPLVVAFGGGKNSTALLIKLYLENIIPDLILFADTGGEIQETYDFIERFSFWLIERGMPPITVVKRKVTGLGNRSTYSASVKNYKWLPLHGYQNTKLWALLVWWVGITAHSFETLEENCLVTQYLPGKAFGRGTCSAQWKVAPQDDYIKTHPIWKQAQDNGVKIRKMIGIHSDETSRLIDKRTKQLRAFEDESFAYEYPLVARSINEFDCRVLIASQGLDIPPKSSCFFCPSRKISDVKALPEELRVRGELMEHIALNGVNWDKNTSTKGLGRRFKWSDIDELTPLELAAQEYAASQRTCHCID